MINSDDQPYNYHQWEVPAELWAKLKPLARQKRRELTPAERVMWQKVRNRQLDNLKIRRQHGIERFIVDFYCHEAKLIIEIDGPIHDYTPEEDAIRQQYLELKYRVVRFTNDAVFNSLPTVLQSIAKVARE